MKPSDWAWVALGLYVFVYDMTAREGDTLSEACDRYLEARPLLTRAIATLVTRHLLNEIDPRIDPLAMLFAFKSRRSASRRPSQSPLSMW